MTQPFNNFISGLPVASSVGSSDVFYVEQGGTSKQVAQNKFLPYLTANVFNVKNFGAIGNGSIDDTAAVNSAIAAFNTAGKGVLYFPAGTYLCSSALTTITANGIVQGDGPSNLLDQLGDGTYGSGGSGTPCTQINCSSLSANFINVNGSKTLLFSNLSVLNTNATGATGSGITVTHATDAVINVSYSNIQVGNFNINVDSQSGSGWYMIGCQMVNPKTYGIKIRNIVNADIGDWQIISSVFIPTAQSATSAIRLETSGGGKILSCKVNCNFAVTHSFANGVDVAISAATADLAITACSFENFNTNGIVINGTSFTWPNITISCCEFASIGSLGAIAGISLISATVVAIVGNVFATTLSSAAVVFSGTNTGIGCSANILASGVTMFSGGTPDNDASGGVGGQQFFVWDGTSILSWSRGGSNPAILRSKSTSSGQYAAIQGTNDAGNSVGIIMLGSLIGGERQGKGQMGSDTALIFASDQAAATGGTDVISFRAGGFNVAQEVFQATPSGRLALTNSANFTANGTGATALTSLGPAGSHNNVQKWLTVTDGTNTLYIPCF